jgi:hypothetical protein
MNENQKPISITETIVNDEIQSIKIDFSINDERTRRIRRSLYEYLKDISQLLELNS